MATYTNAQIEPLAQRMVQQLPGLDINLARAWIKSESGVGNNPLGVTSVQGGVSKLNTYPTPMAGIDAAINLLKSSSYYAGIRSAIGSGSLTDQAKAIIASPWHSRGSPYYTRVFGAAGFLSSAPPTIPSGGASTPITQLPNTTTPGSSITQDTLKKIGVPSDPTHVLTELDVWKIRLYATGSDLTLPFDPNSQFYKVYADRFLGKSVSDLISSWESGEVIQQTPSAFGFELPNFDIVAAVMFIGVILVGITLIGTGGLIALKGKK